MRVTPAPPIISKDELARALSYKDAIFEHATANSIKPAFVAAIGSRETRWDPKWFLGDIDPVTKIPHGHSPMQIDDRSFPTWCRDYRAGKYTPIDGIKMGCQVIAAKRRALFGPHGLLTGIAAWSVEFMDCCIADAYNSGEGRVADLVKKQQDPDIRTTGHDYGSDVLRRMAFFAENGFE